MAEERHLTRAAERLGIRPTSLSQQILALECDLGRGRMGARAAGAGFAGHVGTRMPVVAARRRTDDIVEIPDPPRGRRL